MTHNYVVVSKLSIKNDRRAPEKEREIKGNAHGHGHQSYLALAHISPRGRSIYFRTSSALKRWDYALSPLSSFGDGREMQREKGVIREEAVIQRSRTRSPALPSFCHPCSTLSIYKRLRIPASISTISLSVGNHVKCIIKWINFIWGSLSTPHGLSSFFWS